MANLDLERLHRCGAAHYRAKRDELAENELVTYQSERSRLEQALREAQHGVLAPGHPLRRNLRVPCGLLVHLSMGDRIVRGSTLDVSASGLGVECGDPVEVTDVMNVRLSMPDGEPLFARGRKVYIQRCDDGGLRFGCEFVEIAEEEIERLERLVFENVLDQLAS